MSGQIHRFKKERDFVQLDTHALRNPELSFKAKGLHSYLLQLPENWQVNIADLSKRSTDGRDSVSTGIAELIEAGYIIRERAFDENGLFAGYDYNVFEQPEHAETWKSVNGKSVNGKSVNGKSVNGKSVTNNNEEEQELFETKIKGVNAGASAPLSPPFKKVDEIQSLEAEKEKDFNTGAGGAPTVVKLYDNQLPGVTIVDSIPPKPMTSPETSGRQKQTRNTPQIHPENEACFSYFSDPAKARTAWQEWLEYKYEQHRERYKAAKSELAKLRQLFKQFSGDSEKFETAINYSIGNLYKGVFPPKQEKENGQFKHLDKAQQQHLKLARFVADLRTGAAFADTRQVEYVTGEKHL